MMAASYGQILHSLVLSRSSRHLYLIYFNYHLEMSQIIPYLKLKVSCLLFRKMAGSIQI